MPWTSYCVGHPWRTSKSSPEYVNILFCVSSSAKQLFAHQELYVIIPIKCIKRFCDIIEDRYSKDKMFPTWALKSKIFAILNKSKVVFNIWSWRTRMFFLETCVVLNALFHEPGWMFHDWSSNFNHPYALLTVIDIGVKWTFRVPYFCTLPIELICILNKLEIYIIVDPKTNWLIIKSTLACFTKSAKCITLSVLETSLQCREVMTP